jgi:hypothetical protein
MKEGVSKVGVEVSEGGVISRSFTALLYPGTAFDFDLIPSQC